MSRPTAVAAVLLASYAVLAVVGLAMYGATPSERMPEANDAAPFFGQVLFAVTILVFTVVGAVIAAHLPRHPVGWLLLLVGVLNGIVLATDGYAALALYADRDPLPGGVAAALAATLADDTQWWVLLLTLLLFPDGRLPSRRWRAVAGMLVLVGLAETLYEALRPGVLVNYAGVENPLGIAAVPRLSTAPLDAVSSLAMLALVVSLAARWWHGGPAARQQLKPILLAVSVTLALILVSGVLGPAPRLLRDLLAFVIVLCFSAIALAIAVAVLRYRLYDIDVVINRALVYAVLTAGLVGVYLLGVVGLGALLRPLAGDSDLAVAGSTLLVAALFRPLRVRVQRVVDRRFYRRKYDAERTLDTFARELRDQVDLDALGSRLRHAADRTVQPAGIGVWLQPSRGGRRADG